MTRRPLPPDRPRPATRRRGALALAAVLAVALAEPVRAQPRGEDVGLIDRRTQSAINAGLGYLKVTERNPDGSFGQSNNAYRVAVTALAGLSFLAGGSVPGRGEHGPQVEGAVEYLLSLSETSSSGFLGGPRDLSKMHGHGYATLFLAEVYGMTRDEASRVRIGVAIKRAVKCIVDAQETNTGELGEWGGWGYLPGDRDHEGSITVCCLQALRASRDVGFQVPRATLVKAIRYLIESQNPDGSFMYRIGGASNHSTLPLTAAAIATFNAFGVYDDTVTRLVGEELPRLPGCMRKGLAYLERRLLDEDASGDRYYDNFMYYAEYYASQAFYKSTFPQGGRLWLRYYRRIQDKLISSQRADGSWTDSVNAKYGLAYNTATATLILQIPNGYLPIFQR